MMKGTPPVTQASPLHGRAEQRASARARIEASVDLHTDTNFFAGLSEDLSDGGLFIATYALLAVGTAVTVSFTLPNERRVNANARVAWLRETRDGSVTPGMGIRFESLAPEDAEAIHEFAAERPPLFYEV